MSVISEFIVSKRSLGTLLVKFFFKFFNTCHRHRRWTRSFENPSVIAFIRAGLSSVMTVAMLSAPPRSFRAEKKKVNVAASDLLDNRWATGQPLLLSSTIIHVNSLY
uniref:Uncharacterized protein n=1 Tax=Cacopsylla melanoneura TaxID=428564 RepID=A0A8D8S3M7_9HEMI